MCAYESSRKGVGAQSLALLQGVVIGIFKIFELLCVTQSVYFLKQFSLFCCVAYFVFYGRFRLIFAVYVCARTFVFAY